MEMRFLQVATDLEYCYKYRCPAKSHAHPIDLLRLLEFWSETPCFVSLGIAKSPWISNTDPGAHVLLEHGLFRHVPIYQKLDIHSREELFDLVGISAGGR